MYLLSVICMHYMNSVTMEDKGNHEMIKCANTPNRQDYIVVITSERFTSVMSTGVFRDAPQIIKMAISKFCKAK